METCRLLLILVAMGLAAAQVDFTSPCYLMPYAGGRKLIDVEIPQNCTQGTVNWNYPAGTINLHLTRDGVPYLLCLQNTWTTKIGGLKKVVNGVETEIPLPTKVVMACTKDVDGKTRFLVSAPSDLLYMTSFDYKVVIPVAA